MSANDEAVLPEPNESSAPVSRLWGVDVRFIAPILITLILLVGQVSFGILESYPQTLLAIAVSIILEVTLGKILTGKIPHLASAYISGISVGILIRSPFFWPFALCAAISITSKYVLRLKGRHIWNPSNFGVSAMLFIAPFAVASLSIQWGNNIRALLTIWIIGSIIIYRLRRFHITLTYVVCFLSFSLIRSFITGHAFLAEAAPLTGPMYQLFVFFMITDPRTGIRQSVKAQCVFAFMVAAVEFVLRLFEVVHSPYYALFLVGPVATIIDIFWLSGGVKKSPIEAAA
jgi:enediyne biosynthesis protein E5